MNYHEKLDSVLLTLSKIDDPDHKNSYEVNSKLKEKLSDLDIELILEHLVLIGFASEHEKVANYGKFLKPYNNYRITIQGLLFLEKTSFKSMKRQAIIEKVYIIAKTAITAISTFAIIILTYFNYLATDKANDNTKIIDKLNYKIDSLKSVKNSFHIDSTNRTKK